MKRKVFVSLCVFGALSLWFFNAHFKATKSRFEPDEKQIETAVRTLGKSTASEEASPLTGQQAVEKSTEIARRLVTFFGKTNETRGVANFGHDRGTGVQVPNPEQQKEIDELLGVLPASTVLHMDGFSGTLRYLRGDLSSVIQGNSDYEKAKASGDCEAMAYALLRQLCGVMNLEAPEEEFEVTEISNDKIGLIHIALAQKIEGLSVWGADIKVHLGSDFMPIEISGIYAPPPRHEFWPSKAIPESEAVANALVEVKSCKITSSQVEKIAYWNPDTKPYPCYRVAVEPADGQAYYVFVSALDGHIVHVYNRVIDAVASGYAQDLQGNSRLVNSYYDQGTYYALDITLPSYNSSASQPPMFDQTYGGLFVLEDDSGIDYVRSTSSTSWDAAAVSAQYNLRTAYEYFSNTHSRNSFDDSNAKITSVIHWGASFENAFWNPSDKTFKFGDGASTFKNLAGALDVTAHEFSHAVVSYTANLIYENQSGAMNEHYADLFGAMVDRDDWLIGEDICKTAVALRDMQNPRSVSVLSQLPDRMSDYNYLPNNQDNDNGGVHINCGILNRMAYVLSDEVPAIGKNKLELIAYHALDNYLVQYSQFIDYRRAMISAAQDLYGWGSAEEGAVKAAFNAVEIYDDTGSPSPVVYSNTGEEQTLFLFADEDVYNAEIDSPYLLGVNLPGGNYLVSNRYLQKTRPVMSGDTMELAFLDINGDLWGIDENGEQLLIEDTGLQSFSVSKDSRYFSFVYPNMPTIYIYDSEADQNWAVDLEIAQTDGMVVELGNPDISTFSPSGDKLVFDATSKISFSDGSEYDFWGIYSIRMADRSIFPVWQPSQGLMFGNPHFSNLHPDLIVADMVYVDSAECSAVSINMWHQDGYILTDGNESFAHSSFSGLDNDLLFVEKGWIYNNLYAASFNSSYSTVSSVKVQLYEQSDPIAYPVGIADNEAYVSPKADIVTASSWTFSETEVGLTEESSLIVSNSGTAMLEIYDLHLFGANTNDFSFSAPVSLVSPGGSVTLNLRFHPKSSGAKQTLLQIYSTDPDRTLTEVFLAGAGVDPDPDSDDDGLPDEWEMKHFKNLDSGKDDDGDLDGLSNYSEYIATTDPTNSASKLIIENIRVENGVAHISWCGGTGSIQRIMATDAMGGAWSARYTNQPPTLITNSIELPMAPVGKQYFKLEAQLP